MRLLLSDTSNGLRFKEFDKPLPKYAILSHRWGPNEVIYDDIIASQPTDGPRWEKILKCCEKARQNKYEYVWIDTCCIDKKSSAELSEAINSMYWWYKKSSVCYAFLQDVETTSNPESDDSSFRNSVWFTRGWTLQELIAPKNVIFLDADWQEIGTKETLAETVSQITNVECGVLCGDIKLSDVCVAKKMAWASKRETLKVEDRAYSLLGIFGVNMTTIYGEGEGAFVRLQQEIMHHSSDHTIFAWDSSREEDDHPQVPEDLDDDRYTLLAPSPDEFADSADYVGVSYSHFARVWGLDNAVPELRLTNVGISMEIPLIPTANPRVYLGVLACRKRNTVVRHSMQYCMVAVALYQHSFNRFARLGSCGLINVDCLKDMGIVSIPTKLFADDIYDDDDSSSESSDEGDADDNDDDTAEPEETEADDEEGADSDDDDNSDDNSDDDGDDDEDEDEDDQTQSDTGSNQGEDDGDDDDDGDDATAMKRTIELVLNAPTIRLLREEFGFILDHKESDFGGAKTNLHKMNANKKDDSQDFSDDLDLMVVSSKYETLALRFVGQDSDSALTLSIDLDPDDPYPDIWDEESEMYWNEHSGSTTPGVRHQSRNRDDDSIIEVMFTQIGTGLRRSTYLMEIQIHSECFDFNIVCYLITLTMHFQNKRYGTLRWPS